MAANGPVSRSPLPQADAAASAWRFRGGQVAPRAGPTHSRGSAPSPLPPLFGFPAPAAAGAGLGVGVPRWAMPSPYERRGLSAPEHLEERRSLIRGVGRRVARACVRTYQKARTVCPGSSIPKPVAEGVGFEPTVGTRPTTVFETAPISLSGTPPGNPHYSTAPASLQPAKVSRREVRPYRDSTECTPASQYGLEWRLGS